MYYLDTCAPVIYINLKFIGIEELCVFKSLCDLVFPSLPDGSKLSKFDMVLLFLMKIHLNVMDEDLAFRFGVHQTTISRNFHRVLNGMYVRLYNLVMWPDRGVLPTDYAIIIS